MRRCHGDLHLRNICLIEGAPVLFDATEFSEEIGTIDVLYYIAFLLMDLERHHLRRFGNIGLNCYLEKTNDYDGLATLSLFMSLRAGVRAHTSAAAARIAAVTQRATIRQHARAYLTLASALLRPSRGAIVAVGGLSGAGKSTLAAEIAPDLGRSPGALVLRSDVMRRSYSDSTRWSGSVQMRIRRQSRNGSMSLCCELR